MENRLPPAPYFLHDDELLDGKDKKKIFLDFCFGEKYGSEMERRMGFLLVG